MDEGPVLEINAKIKNQKKSTKAEEDNKVMTVEELTERALELPGGLA